MQLETLGLPTLLTFIALMCSAIAIWIPFRVAWAALLGIAIVFGYVAGVLSGPAIVPLAAFAFICWTYRKWGAAQHSMIHVFLALLVVVMAALLGAHIFPWFHNPTLAKEFVLSPDAAPYTRRLYFDKTTAGILILVLCYSGIIRSHREWRDALGKAWLIVVVNIAVVVALSLALGYVRFAPKWTSFFWPWAIVMIFSTCLAEEALFRGFIQRELESGLRTYRFGNVVALTTSAILFGLYHFDGGITYVLLATVAGFGYGLVFQRTGRIEMSILAHFLLNTIHFIFFTYPYVANS
ncbi:MAG: CPBP family intramembrane metalloprotease [Gammaproteobacteria bacterium]|nr:CPBP family intramembrane metalloprotease [Gammaproteobacteria bacterium]